MENAEANITAREEQLAFYYMIGRAITQWANIEFALAGIVAGCFCERDAERSAAGFLSIDNFRAKLQFADMIIATHDLSDTERDIWKGLRKRAERLANNRNQLAHHWAIHTISNKAGQRVGLLPTRPEKAKIKDLSDPLCVSKISGYQLEFFALFVALENFSARLVGREEPLPKAWEQAKPPKTLQEIREEIYLYVHAGPERDLNASGLKDN